jgi:hypothetical protein
MAGPRTQPGKASDGHGSHLERHFDTSWPLMAAGKAEINTQRGRNL